MANRSARIVVAAFCTTLIAYAIRYGYGMLLPDMINSMGISKTGAGTIYSSYFLSYTLFSPLLGWLSDRYNIRIIMTCFTLLLASGAFLMAYIGLWTGFMGVGSILSPTLCGWSTDKTDGYTMAFTMGTVCAVGAALFLIPVRQQLSKN